MYRLLLLATTALAQLQIDTLISRINPDYNPVFPNTLKVLSDDIRVMLTKCPAGYYCPKDTTKPVPCPGGYWSAGIGRITIDTCLECLETTYCPPGTSSPIVCPPGTYNQERVQSECMPCPAGFYCTGPDFDPFICEAGTYSFAGASMCTSCSPGYYSIDTKRGIDCDLCPANHYCPTPTTVIHCPPNTGGPPGSYELKDCVCDVGYLCVYRNTVNVRLQVPVAGFDPVLYAKAVAEAIGVDPSQVKIQ